MGLVELVVVGLIVGVIARFLVPGRQPFGILGTLAAGVGGALLGWWVGGRLAAASVAAHPWLWAIGGAVVLVLALSQVSARGLRRGWR